MAAVFRRARGLAIGGIMAIAACGGTIAHPDYVGAEMTAATGVVGASVHRATTGGCWGQCLGGLVCDHATGTCAKRAPCGGRCAAHERCEEAAASERCVERGDGDVDASSVSTDADAPPDSRAP